MSKPNNINSSLKKGIQPEPDISVSQWADCYRVLSPQSASTPGRWHTSRTPYLQEIMDCLSASSQVERIVFMKGAQLGGTEVGNNWIGYMVHHVPGPMLAVSPTVEMAKRNSKQRIDPLIENVPELKALIKPPRSRDSGNTMLSKRFPNGVLVMTGANSAVGLRSMPARYLFLDEIDTYPGDVNGEGDPVMLAERRSANFAGIRKIFLVSTPTTKDSSRIQREFEHTDQRYFKVPCPHCQHYQVLKFKQLKWSEGKPESTYYCCEQCNAHIEEHHKTKMLDQGYWEATGSADTHTRGYHLSSLYSPLGWFAWSEVAKLYEQAKDDQDVMKSFVNTVLGEPFEQEYEAPEWTRLYERRETYPIGIIPDGGLFLTAGVDVQRDRLECEIVAWGRDKQSWSVDYQVLSGDSAQPAVWEKLDKLLAQDWPHACGATLPIQVMCVDSGYVTQSVYAWVRQHLQAIFGGAGLRISGPRTVVAIKGRDGETALIPNVSRVDLSGKRRALRLCLVSGPVAKAELYSWLKLPRPTDEDLAQGKGYLPGTCHFPEYSEEYFKQLTAERRVIRLHKGFPKASWEKDPTRNNEALDCRVYARAGAAIYGLDRFQEVHWKNIEQELAIGTKISMVKTTSTNNHQTEPLTYETSEIVREFFRPKRPIPPDDPSLYPYEP